ncbi:MAG: HAMP domain-containing protein [Acidobacteriaceae bacterium]|nr:HAMP domain-containing protein [Acidobacteriaceae bacterium]
MRTAFSRIPLQWRVFLATSITVTVLFAVAGWGFEQYTLSVADESVRTEIRASIQAYEAVWRARTQVLSAATALMGAMSDVRAAFMTKDRETIRDSAQELWSRVSDQSAVFLVLDPEGRLIASLGDNSGDLSAPEIPLAHVRSRFPRQLAGYLQANAKLFYVVLTPVYVQTSSEPLLLNVLCAGFRIDNHVAGELKRLAPGSEFSFLSEGRLFASTLDGRLGQLSAAPLRAVSSSDPVRVGADQYIVSRQQLDDIIGKPVAELRILHSYANVASSLSRLRRSLGVAWLVTVAIALLVSLFTTRRLLEPVQRLDRAASEIASRNYDYRVPITGNDEFSRLAATFNHMCDSVQQAQTELIRQEQINTIGRLGTSLVHDLRNPLAAIYGGAEMLVDGQLPPDQTRRIATNIYRASHRVQELLRDLLNVSRGEPRNVEMCRLRDIIEAGAEPFETLSSDLKIRVGIEPETEVFVDRTRVERVFTNLLSNAADAMPLGGEIFIYAKEGERVLDVFVEDTGPGVAPDVRDQLFQPFLSAGKRTGLGLGLTMSRQTMLDNGGDLDLVETHGPGACFRVRFPKPARTPAPPGEASAAYHLDQDDKMPKSADESLASG